MRVEELPDGSQERRILTAMITDTTMLGRVSTAWDSRNFRSRWAGMVGDWCVDYYRKYGKAPGRSIEGLYEVWTADAKDPDTQALVERFLSGLSLEYEQAETMNSQYALDLAGTLFSTVRAERFRDRLDGLIRKGKTTEIDELFQSWKRVEIGKGKRTDIFTDPEAIKAAFAEQVGQPLVEYPGDLGLFFGDTLERDGFVAFTAPEKRGKTFWLMDLAWRAMCQRRKVAFISAGDMSENQVKNRFYVRAAKKPRKSPDRKWPYVVKYPTSLKPLPDDSNGPQAAEVEYSEKVFDAPLSHKEAIEACRKVMERTVRSKDSYFGLSCYPAGQLDVDGIRSILNGWELEGFVADVVVIDYADILAPPSGYRERIDQVDKTWEQLRALSSERHCLVVTATQANAAAYQAKTMNRANFSQNKRKEAHVTAMIGINQTSAEKERGIYRLNYFDRREGACSDRKCVHVASCLALANPAVRSSF